MTQAELLERLPSILPAGALRSSDVVRGQAVADLERTLMRDALAALRDHPDVRLEMLSDLTAVDYLGRVPRFRAVVGHVVAGSGAGAAVVADGGCLR